MKMKFCAVVFLAGSALINITQAATVECLTPAQFGQVANDLDPSSYSATFDPVNNNAPNSNSYYVINVNTLITGPKGNKWQLLGSVDTIADNSNALAISTFRERVANVNSIVSSSTVSGLVNCYYGASNFIPNSSNWIELSLVSSS